MGAEWKKWSRRDALNGVAAPLAVVLVIVGLSQLSSFLSKGEFGFISGIIMELEEVVVIAAVPLLLGLIWNQWAGGTSGFLMGTLFALYIPAAEGIPNWSAYAGAGTPLLGYILSAMFMGYAAGALNRRSKDFRRMTISGVTAGTIGGLLLFGIFQLSPTNLETGINGFLLTVLPRTACGLIIAAIAKLVSRYGWAINKKPTP
jgi:hypothetical protein